MLSSVEKQLVRELLTRYSETTTLKELVDEVDNTPIDKVVFNLRGYYEDAYELDGDTFEISGTIAEIFEDACEGFESPLKDKDTGVPLTEKLGEVAFTELALFFVGDRTEDHRTFTVAEQSREVTIPEIIEYLKTLYVDKSFDYSMTMQDF